MTQTSRRGARARSPPPRTRTAAWDVQVQIHPIHALNLQRHMPRQDISSAASYRHGRLRSTGPTRPLTASGGSTQDPRVLDLDSTGAYLGQHQRPPAQTEPSGPVPAAKPRPAPPPRHRLVGLGRSPVRHPWSRAMATPWDACTYDRSSEPQQAWASGVLARLGGIARDATVLDVGCGTGRVTEALLALVP